MSTTPTPQLSGLSGVVLTVRFLTELAMLAGLAVAGARLGTNVATSVGYAVVLPVAVAVVWGWVIGPRASRRLPEPARFLLEGVLFGGTAALLVVTDWLVAGIVLAVVGIGIAALTRVVAPGG